MMAKAKDRARRRRPPGYLLAEAVAHLGAARAALERHRAEHPLTCRCGFCGGRDRCDVDGIHDDIPHVAWVIRDLVATVEMVSPPEPTLEEVAPCPR